MSKLTKAKKRTLAWYIENDGSRFRPNGVSKLTISRLVEDGLLLEKKPVAFGFIRHFITDAGRAALDQDKEATGK